MKRVLVIGMVLISTLSFGQKLTKKINNEVTKMQFESHLRFLASDEMRGRNTATIENEVAARYIANRLWSYGAKPAPGQEDYMQPVKLVKSTPPEMAQLTIGDENFVIWKDLIFLTAEPREVTTEMVYAGFGFPEDLEGKDVKGKLIIAKAGNGNPDDGFYGLALQKIANAKKMGAIGLVELYRPAKYPWNLLINYLSGDRFVLDNDQDIEQTFTSAWLLDKDGKRLEKVKEMDGKEVTLKIVGAAVGRVEVPNVVGYIEGTDPKLKDEYVMITAHFDHVGVKKVEGDSIWNGAR